MKHEKIFFSLMMVAFLTLTACASSTGVATTQPSSSDQVATVVAATMQALPTNTPAAITPESPAELLPHTLYYLGRDDNTGLTQVFRMERDGKTSTQLTHELVNVLDYDISLADGHLVYEVDNQLILINADGSNRQVLTEGATRSVDRGYYHPMFSPDGKTLAYANGGLVFHDPSTGLSTLVLEDQPLGGSLPPAIYSPDKFSPDGTKLLISIGHPPDSPWTGAIYFPATQTLLPFAGDSESITCCRHYGGAEWSADSSSFYAVARVPDSSLAGGELWRVDANTGAVTTLIPGGAGEGESRLFYFPYKPYLAPDGQLYFFSAKFPESAGYFKRAPLILIRTKPDDILNHWTVLRGDTFEMMNEALWTPDASFVIVAFAPIQEVYDGGQAEIVYFDGRPNTVLTTFAQQMKWGP